MREIEYRVPIGYEDVPLYFFLKDYAGISTRIIQTLRHTRDAVFINGIQGRVVDKVRANDRINIYIPEKGRPPEPWEKEPEIIYEDEDLLIINKPAGVSVHPTKNHPNGTLCNAVAAYLQKKNKENCVPRAVGRLDKVTSGVMVFAKNAYIASRLNGALSKTYWAIATGKTREIGTVDAPIFRPDPNKTLRAVGEGDSAITHYRMLKGNGEKSFLEIKTETGRTHQIRVHCSYIGHPLVGDVMYGGYETKNMKRAALHCREVTLTNPISGKVLTFTAPLPADMTKESDEIERHIPDSLKKS